MDELGPESYGPCWAWAGPGTMLLESWPGLNMPRPAHEPPDLCVAASNVGLTKKENAKNLSTCTHMNRRVELLDGPMIKTSNLLTPTQYAPQAFPLEV